MRATLAGEPPIELRLRRNARARRISLRVSQLDGRVTLTVPPAASVAEAVRFARAREDWVRRILEDVAPRRRPEIGAKLPVEGLQLPIVAAGDGRARITGRAIFVPADRPVGNEIGALLQRLARDRAQAAAARHAATLGRKAPRVTVRDTRSRWGSCTEAGRIMLSWRLAMAPPEVLDYVAAHEVAHLEFLDHSPDFWSVTESLCRDWRRHRGWLRREGAALHAIDFG